MDTAFTIIVTIMAVVGGFVGGFVGGCCISRREDVAETQDGLLYATINEKNRIIELYQWYQKIAHAAVSSMPEGGRKERLEKKIQILDEMLE